LGVIYQGDPLEGRGGGRVEKGSANQGQSFGENDFLEKRRFLEGSTWHKKKVREEGDEDDRGKERWLQKEHSARQFAGSSIKGGEYFIGRREEMRQRNSPPQ